MIGKSTKILKALARDGEVSLHDALWLTGKCASHVDQYPLAMLIEAGYVGMSMDSERDVTRTDEMRELKRAIDLYMFSLPRDKSGCCEYMGVTSCGHVDPKKQQVFLRAAGALHLDARLEKFRERLYSFFIGVSVGLIAAFVNAYIRGPACPALTMRRSTDRVPLRGPHRASLVATPRGALKAIMAPRVFLSHASEDKDCFVLRFAAALRANGIDVWVDRWEILPGDSLVNKIFEEGLKDATAVIIVLSRNSVNKAWVREELNAATVKRISSGTKLIPVVIDDCEVPESLKSTVWERVTDLNQFDEALHRIVASILELRDRPALGTPPAFARNRIAEIPGLTDADTYVLKLSCEWVIEHNEPYVDPNILFRSGTADDMPEAILRESLDILDQQRYIKLRRLLGPGPFMFAITAYGLGQYLRTFSYDYDQLVRDVAICLLNTELHDNESIASKVERPQRLVDHVLDLFESRGHLRHSRYMSGLIQVYQVSPSLRREFG